MSSQATSSPEDANQELALEPDRPPVFLIIIAITIVNASIIAVVAFAYQYFFQSVSSEISKKQSDKESAELKEVRTTEESLLTKYQWVSQKDKVVRIPLARAKELTLKDWDKRPKGLAGDESAHAPQPSQTAAPSAPPQPSTPPSAQPSTSASVAPALAPSASVSVVPSSSPPKVVPSVAPSSSH